MLKQISNWLRERRVARVLVTEEQWAKAEAALPILSRWSSEERTRLRQLAIEFIAEKQWSSANGLVLTPQIQLIIALQACLLVFNLGLDWYRGWSGIIVYPGDFAIPRRIVDEVGVVHEYDDPALGEAWQGGPVIISWFDGADCPQDVNPVIHEFAHKLDMLNGSSDGMPPLHSDMSRRTWCDAFGRAYAELQRQLDLGEDTAIDPYAAEEPAEFFAVASEAFFDAPAMLATTYPDVFNQLCIFYRQNPLEPVPAEL
ncbi:MAG: zinc-dependent peptidase [Rhodocyclaceae bacterium]|jgi:hypothetical protein|nr:zinc-dependent peptidase [Rhodocyclaceae bacterium]